MTWHRFHHHHWKGLEHCYSNYITSSLAIRCLIINPYKYRIWLCKLYLWLSVIHNKKMQLCWIYIHPHLFFLPIGTDHLTRGNPFVHHRCKSLVGVNIMVGIIAPRSWCMFFSVNATTTAVVTSCINLSVLTLSFASMTVEFPGESLSESSWDTHVVSLSSILNLVSG